MRRYRLAAASVVAGLACGIPFGSSALAATIAWTQNAAQAVSRPSLSPRQAVPKLSIATRITLAPQTVTPTNSSVTLTAQAFDWQANPLPKQRVSFAILEGPNAGAALPAPKSNADGSAWTLTFSSNKPGTDIVQATFTDGLEVHRSNRSFVEWHTGPVAAALRSPAAIQISPSCFQPAIAETRASDSLKSVTPKKKNSGSPPSETGTISVTGADFNPLADILITFDAGAGGKPQNFTAQTDAFGAFLTTIKVTEPQEGAHLIRADDFREREAQAIYTLPCSQGNIALHPAIGPPGFVAEVVGRDFPPNSPITVLNWTKPNIVSPLWPSQPLVTDGQGNFQFFILVLYHDELGPRTIRAVVQDTQPNHGNALIAADAPFFVTLGRAQPADLVLRR
jgi:hypothetical protein